MSNSTFLYIVEIIGTFAFAISGIRMAARKRFDLFGAYVVGLVTAIGGGTLRDVLLDVTPFWMSDSIYLIITAVALLLVIVLRKNILRFENKSAFAQETGAVGGVRGGAVQQNLTTTPETAWPGASEARPSPDPSCRRTWP
jgi:uncharacterized membrane protein YeiH